MGLAAAKRKRKVGLDPNNTRWARNVDSFGQKILRAQGWEPGQYLGAKDAAHAQFHTAANASHVRAILKEDNLGLGAKRALEDQCTGLGDFQDLLGRLNGKTETTLDVERKAREDLKLNLYLERKLGTMKFVKGGWLVGDQEQMVLESPSAENSKPHKSSKTATEAKLEVSTRGAEEKREAKRRKVDADASSEIERKAKREERRRRKLDKQAATTAAAIMDGPTKREKKKRRSQTRTEESELDPVSPVSDDEANTYHTSPAERTEQPVAKRTSQKKKKSRDLQQQSGETSESENRHRKKRQKGAVESLSPAENLEQPDQEMSQSSSSALKNSSRVVTPQGSGTSTPIRHLSRQRFIAQKRMAFSDPAALNQIFMIKSES